MRRNGRSIPSISVSIPSNGRSKGWNFRSKAIFRWKNSPDLCHIAAKIEFLGVPAAVLRKDVSENQAFQFFAYLRAKEQARENIRFSVLKTSGSALLLRAHSGCCLPVCVSLRGARLRLGNGKKNCVFPLHSPRLALLLWGVKRSGSSVVVENEGKGVCL